MRRLPSATGLAIPGPNSSAVPGSGATFSVCTAIDRIKPSVPRFPKAGVTSSVCLSRQQSAGIRLLRSYPRDHGSPFILLGTQDTI